MALEARKTSGLHRYTSSESNGASVGEVQAICPDGRVLVDYPGNTLGPLHARTALARSERVEAGMAVLLAFENGDPARPIIAGVVRDTMLPAKAALPVGRKRGTQDELIVDGQAISITAEQEVVIRCGDSSITLTKDGRIVLKGKEIVSRASGVNKIKGAAVNIN